MYKPHCGHSERRFGGITCLSLTGWLFTMLFTYLGFACMITGKPAAAAAALVCTCVLSLFARDYKLRQVVHIAIQKWLLCFILTACACGN